MAEHNIVSLITHIAALEAAAREKDKDAKALRIQFKVDQSRLEAMKDAQERRGPDAIIKESGYAALIHEALTNPVTDRHHLYNQINRDLHYAEHNKLAQFCTDSLYADSDQMSEEYYQYKKHVLRKTECETREVRYRDNIAAAKARKRAAVSSFTLDIPHLEIIQTELVGLMRAQKANREELASISLVSPVLRLTTPNPIWIEMFDLLHILFGYHDKYMENTKYFSTKWFPHKVNVTLPAEVADILPRLISGTADRSKYVFPVCMPKVFVLTINDRSLFREDQRLLLAGFGVILDFRNHDSELDIRDLSPCGPKMCLPKK